MIRNIILAGLSLVLVLMLSIGLFGCGDGGDGNGNGGSGKISDTEMIEKAIAASDDAETYKFDMNMAMEMSGESMGENFSMDMTIDGDGMVDSVNQEMQMDMDVSMKMDMGTMGDMDVDAEMATYIVDNVMYMKTGEMMGMPEQWMKMEMPLGTWESQDMVSQQTELLESAELEISDGGNVNGASCYKVKMTPDMLELFNSLMSQPGMGEGLGVDPLPEGMDASELADMIKDFSVTQWYAKDTFFPMKAEIEMEMVITAEDMGVPGEEGSMDMNISMTMNFKDYNKSVSIKLPSEANEAMDMMDMGGDTGW